MYKKIVLISLIIFFNSCLKSKKRETHNNITCIVKVISKSMNGYGTIYSCEVSKIIEGNLSDEIINITILESNFKQYEILEKEMSSTITFTKNKEKEPYPIMPINGFVDSNSTSWIISKIK